MLGGQVGLIGHITIANGVKIAAQSGITKDIKEEGSVVQGSPAFEFGPYQRSMAIFRNLPFKKLKNFSRGAMNDEAIAGLLGLINSDMAPEEVVTVMQQQMEARQAKPEAPRAVESDAE